VTQDRSEKEKTINNVFEGQGSSSEGIEFRKKGGLSGEEKKGGKLAQWIAG